MATTAAEAMHEQPSRPSTSVAVFFDLSGLPGWGSEPDVTDPDTSTILERHVSPGGEVRLVRGCTALAVFPGVTASLRATTALLSEAQGTSGSVTAGAHATELTHDDIVPDSVPARIAAALAQLADANRLLVTGDLLRGFPPDRWSSWSFDPGPTARFGDSPLATFSIRRS
jgi:hypothetical protein